MPLTPHGQALVDLSTESDAIALRNGRIAAEKQAARRAAWALRHPEQAAANDRAIAEWNAQRDAAFAVSPEHGELWDLTQREYGGSMTVGDKARLAELRRKLTPALGAEINLKSQEAA